MNRKILLKKILFICILLALFLIPIISLASIAAKPNVKLEIPLLGYNKATDIADYIKNIYMAALYIIVPIIIVTIIGAGITWISSGGEAQVISKAKERLKYAIIGLIIALLSMTLINSAGINTLKAPEVEEIDVIDTDEVDTETPDDDTCEDPNPECIDETTSFNDQMKNLFTHAVQAKNIPSTFEGCIKQKRIVQGIPSAWNCPKCANVPELKQNCPSGVSRYSYAGAGTIASSGCGIVALTMVLKFYGKNVTIQQITDQARTAMYRRCPRCNCTPNGCIRCNKNKCAGTKYDAFTNPKQSSRTGSRNLVSYGPSKILQKYNLKGEILTGMTNNIKDTKKKIMEHLAQGHPIIISTDNRKVTKNAHFIVLIGCTNCNSDNYKIFYRDSVRNSRLPFKKSNNLFSTLHSAFWIHP